MLMNYCRIRYLKGCSVISSGARGYRKKRSYTSNVGIKNRLTLFSEENPELEKLGIDERTLDELESELTSSREVVDFHRRNINIIKKKTDLKIIERKYFVKTKIPNFLTWAEKEQIKELHKSDPLFWTFEKLSQSFPATPDIIMKVIKSSWKAESSDRIFKHDKHVSKNWEKLRKGEIELDPTLKEHLSLFSSREYLQQTDDYNHINIKMPPQLKGSEFQKIITNYQKQANPTENNSKALYDKSGESQVPLLEASQTLSRNKSKPLFERRLITLEDLRKRVKEQKLPSEYSEYDEAFLKGAESRTNAVAEIDHYETTAIKNFKNEKKNQAIAKVIEESSKDIPFLMKIQVPKGVPKGSVYRVKDVYYDTDGTFLYRVPGMK